MMNMGETHTETPEEKKARIDAQRKANLEKARQAAQEKKANEGGNVRTTGKEPSPATTTTRSINGDSPKPPTNFQDVKDLKQLEAERSSIANRKYYGNFPKIRGGVCEHCGVAYQKCEHYKQYYAKLGDFICLCGQSSDPLARQQLNLLYLPHRGFFICDSSGCAERYQRRFGGVEKFVSLHFYHREMPYAGNLLPDPTDAKPTAL